MHPEVYSGHRPSYHTLSEHIDTVPGMAPIPTHRAAKPPLCIPPHRAIQTEVIVDSSRNRRAILRFYGFRWATPTRLDAHRETSPILPVSQIKILTE